MASVKILLVEDDIQVCSSLKRLLEMEGFSVRFVHDAESGLKEALAGKHDLVILDIMLAGGDGREVLRKLRLLSQIPLIMLTARGDERDRIAGLESGADDYLPKPFNARELVARIRAVLRRKGDLRLPDIFRNGDLTIDRKQRKATLKGEELSLTGAEFEILLLLAQSVGKVLSRDEIAETALGRPIGLFDRSIDNHVSSLRKKLGPSAEGLERIQNVRGTGYVYTGSEGGDKE